MLTTQNDKHVFCGLKFSGEILQWLFPIYVIISEFSTSKIGNQDNYGLKKCIRY